MCVCVWVDYKIFNEDNLRAGRTEQRVCLSFISSRSPPLLSSLLVNNNLWWVVKNIFVSRKSANLWNIHTEISLLSATLPHVFFLSFSPSAPSIPLAITNHLHYQWEWVCAWTHTAVCASEWERELEEENFQKKSFLFPHFPLTLYTFACMCVPPRFLSSSFHGIKKERQRKFESLSLFECVDFFDFVYVDVRGRKMCGGEKVSHSAPSNWKNQNIHPQLCKKECVKISSLSLLHSLSLAFPSDSPLIYHLVYNFI